MQSLPFFPLSQKLNDYEIILFDLWGVIVEGEENYPGVVDAINQIMRKKKVYFVSNAPRPAFKTKAHLDRWGLEDITEEMIITSGDVARNIIASTIGDKTPYVFHLGADRNEDLLSNFNHKLTNDLNKADVFLLSVYRDDHENIHEFNDLLKEAAALNKFTLCSNPDTTIPKNGAIRYCAGYFAEIFEQFGGSVIYTGKPQKTIYETIFTREPHVAKDRILMIGDTFETDILGAKNVGIHSALVITGNSEKYHKMHDNMENKLLALTKKAKEFGAMPTFVTKIA